MALSFLAVNVFEDDSDSHRINTVSTRKPDDVAMRVAALPFRRLRVAVLSRAVAGR
jgi:hypothetical protein